MSSPQYSANNNLRANFFSSKKKNLATTASERTCTKPSWAKWLKRSGSKALSVVDETGKTIISSNCDDHTDCTLPCSAFEEEYRPAPKSCLVVRTASSCSSPRRKNVQFSHVTTHYFTLELGDHPEVSCGVPIALGTWECTEEALLEDRERQYLLECMMMGKPWNDRSRLSAVARERMLLQQGVSRSTMTRCVERMKKQRRQLIAESKIQSGLAY